jgi:hypothetical protein
MHFVQELQRNPLFSYSLILTLSGLQQGTFKVCAMVPAILGFDFWNINVVWVNRQAPLVDLGLRSMWLGGSGWSLDKLQFWEKAATSISRMTSGGNSIFREFAGSHLDGHSQQTYLDRGDWAGERCLGASCGIIPSSKQALGLVGQKWDKVVV